MRPIATLIGLTFSGLSFAQEPIETRNHRSLSLPFYRFVPTGSLLKAGAESVLFSATSANDLRRLPNSTSPIVSEDYEVERFAVRYKLGTSRGEWSFEAPILVRGGGFQDPLIDWWHRHVLGINNLRSDVPYGGSEVIVPGSPRFGSAAGLGDISATYSIPIDELTSASVGFKLPTGDASRLLGSGNVDGGIAINHVFRLGTRWTLFSQLGLVAQGRDKYLDSVRGLVDQEGLCFIYRANQRGSWSLQWQSESSAVVTGDSGSDSAHRQLTLGYSHQLDPKRTLQLFFTEDGDWLNFRIPEVANIAPDFTIGARLVVKL